MRFRVEVICLSENGAEDRYEVVEVERHELAMETLGLNLAEAKAILGRVQELMTAQQVAQDLDRRRQWGSSHIQVESRRSAGTDRSRPVSHPRSSNRTCRAAASGFPIDFIDRLTDGG